MEAMTQSDWSIKAQALDRSVALRIASETVQPAGNEVNTIDPADGSGGLRYRGADAAQADRAIAVARDPGGGARWWSMPEAARRGCLIALADLVEQHAEQLGLHDCRDIGKPITAAVMEAHVAASLCRYFGEMADKLYAGQSVPTDPGSFAINVRKPRGVVAAITPWNYPIINAVLKLAPALAAGNSVILKPSELSPGSASHLVKLCDEAGIPSGTVGFLPGDGETGSFLARHTGVDMVTFTGSTATGKALMLAAGDNALKPLLLECGGKSPEIVFDDVRDLGVQVVAQAVVAGAMANQGQLCVARSRLYVHASLHDELVDAIASVLRETAPGHPLDSTTTYGPLASPAHLERVREYIDAGESAGATLAVDGRAVAGPADGGCYLGPTLFADIAHDMRIMQEEIFGPVLCVSPFSDETEAVRFANGTPYGLAATVWTQDLGRSHRMTSRIRTGKLHIRATAEQRFGAGWGQESEPYRQSGFGVEGGQAGVLSYTRLQSVQVDFPLTE